MSCSNQFRQLAPTCFWVSEVRFSLCVCFKHFCVSSDYVRVSHTGQMGYSPAFHTIIITHSCMRLTQTHWHTHPPPQKTAHAFLTLSHIKVKGTNTSEISQYHSKKVKHPSFKLSNMVQSSCIFMFTNQLCLLYYLTSGNSRINLRAYT